MTKKLRLSLDALEVESFTVVRDGDVRGTVAGHATELATCATCYQTCGNTCQAWCRTDFGPNCPTQKLTGPCGC